MRVTALFPTALLAALTALAGGCAGPERTPHQPIKGVDTPDNPVDNPHDRKDELPRELPTPMERPAPSAPGTESPVVRDQPQTRDDLLAGFLTKVSAALKGQPGIVAVFPALTKDPETGGAQVNGLGEWLANETQNGLELEGVRGVVAGHGLINDLKAANRGLDALRGLDDVYWLGDRLGASYLCFGAVNKRTFDRLNRDEVLEIDWQCRRVADRAVIANVRQRLTGGALAQQLGKHFASDSEWKIGANAAAPGGEPSADVELRIAARMLAAQVVRKHESLLKNKRVSIAPTSIRGTTGPRASLQAWAVEFDRAFAQAMKKASGSDAAGDALQTGPVKIQDQEFATLGAALAAYQTKSVTLAATPAGELSTDLARMIGERLRELTGETIKVVPDEGERDQLLGLIRREARAQRESDAVDAQTIAALRAKGAEVLVESTLRPFLKSYQLRIVLHDLKSAEQVSEAIDVDEQFKKQLDAVMAR